MFRLLVFVVVPKNEIFCGNFFRYISEKGWARNLFVADLSWASDDYLVSFRKTKFFYERSEREEVCLSKKSNSFSS